MMTDSPATTCAVKDCTRAAVGHRLCGACWKRVPRTCKVILNQQHRPFQDHPGNTPTPEYEAAVLLALNCIDYWAENGVECSTRQVTDAWNNTMRALAERANPTPPPAPDEESAAPAFPLTSPGTDRCPAAGCTELLDPKRLFCAEHWADVPSSIRHELMDAFRPEQLEPGGAASLQFHIAARVAISCVAYRAEHGGFPTKKSIDIARLQIIELIGQELRAITSAEPAVQAEEVKPEE